MMLQVMPLVVTAEGAEVPVRPKGARRVFVAEARPTVVFGRTESAVARVGLDPHWLFRATRTEVPRELLQVARIDGVRFHWRCGTSLRNEFRVSVGPHLRHGAPAWQGEGSVELPVGSSVDLQVWVSGPSGWRHAMTFRVERAVAGAVAPLAPPGTQVMTEGPRDGRVNTLRLIESWIQSLGDVQRGVLWETVQSRDAEDLKAAVSTATGLQDVGTKWNNLAKSLVVFVRDHTDDGGELWLHEVIEFPSLREHVNDPISVKLRAGAPEIRVFAKFLARYGDHLEWGDTGGR